MAGTNLTSTGLLRSSTGRKCRWLVTWHITCPCRYLLMSSASLEQTIVREAVLFRDSSGA